MTVKIYKIQTDSPEKYIVKYFEIYSCNSSSNYVLEKTTYVMGVAESN